MTNFYDNSDEDDDEEVADDPLALNDDIDPELGRAIGEGGSVEPFTDDE
ncbi:MAG: hypothetical protein JWM56_533 [Candidatus Peribacteria bacterium]|nr:hypothetical protein [Candidatus Peribacteria bacterium]